MRNRKCGESGILWGKLYRIYGSAIVGCKIIGLIFRVHTGGIEGAKASCVRTKESVGLVDRAENMEKSGECRFIVFRSSGVHFGVYGSVEASGR